MTGGLAHRVRGWVLRVRVAGGAGWAGGAGLAGFIGLIAATGLMGVTAAAAAPAATDATGFLTGPELGQRLLTDVVRIRAVELREHGFGLVVGATARHVFVATARHVVAGRALADPALRGAAVGRIELSFCAGDDPGVTAREAELVDGFDAGGQDLALLRVLRPAGYTLVARAVADEAQIAVRQEAWLLGQDQQCGLAARSGAIASLRDARDNLRIEFAGVRGGASGGPVLSGYGIVGLVTDADDLSFTVYSLASLRARLRAQSADWWQLADARNIPPTDPRAAEIDLAETLDRYLFGVNNLQQLLLQPTIQQALFVEFSKDYNTAVNRFRDARNRYDGTLARDWPAPVLPMWLALRDQLWQVHQTFWQMNAGDAKLIFDQKKAPAAVQDRMRSLAPALLQLQAGTAEFLNALGQRSKP